MLQGVLSILVKKSLVLFGIRKSILNQLPTEIYSDINLINMALFQSCDVAVFHILVFHTFFKDSLSISPIACLGLSLKWEWYTLETGRNYPYVTPEKISERIKPSDLGGHSNGLPFQSGTLIFDIPIMV